MSNKTTILDTKIYYVISRMDYSQYKIFNEILEGLGNGIELNYYLSDEYFKDILDIEDEDIRAGSIYHELVFLKYIKEKKLISFKDINWIYNEELVVFNEDLLILKNNKWIKINNEKIHIIAVKLASNNPFWFLLEKLPNIKISFGNKRKNYRFKWDKLEFIIDIYKKREEYIGDFMLPLYKDRSLKGIKNIFLLWKGLSGKNICILKGSYLSDNGKDIKLIEIDKIIEREDLLEYIYIKFLKNIYTHNGSFYITDWYDCKKEYRFYVNQNVKTKNVKIYYLKHKINLTKKEDLLNKRTIETGIAMRTRWENGDLKNTPEKLLKATKYILKNIEETSGAIEFIEENNGNIRFLEINDLGDSFVKDKELEKYGKKWIYGILNNFNI